MNDIDIQLIVDTLRQRGHKVDGVFSVPDNAGIYEFNVDGNLLNLEETRQLLERESPK